MLFDSPLSEGRSIGQGLFWVKTDDTALKVLLVIGKLML